jgi:inner membrane protein
MEEGVNMLGKTHIALGLAAATTITSIVPVPNLTFINDKPIEMCVLVVGTTLGSLMPDIDKIGSKIDIEMKKIITNFMLVLFSIYLISKIFYFDKAFPNTISFIYSNIRQSNYSFKVGLITLISLVIFSKFTKHRTFTHSIIGVSLYTLSIFLLLKSMTIAFFVGYIVHIAADSLTNSGIALLYPFVKDKDGKHHKYGFGLFATSSIYDWLLSVIGTVIVLFRFI